MDELTKYIHTRARLANVHLDTYDPDFIIGVITEWLNNNNQILTPTGLKHKDEVN